MLEIKRHTHIGIKSPDPRPICREVIYYDVGPDICKVNLPFSYPRPKKQMLHYLIGERYANNPELPHPSSLSSRQDRR